MKSVRSHVTLAKYAVLTVLITLLGGVANPTASAAPEPGALPTAGSVTVTPVTGDPALGDDIEETYVQLHYPSRFVTTAHPAECDQINFLRYRHKNGPQNTADADAVTTMQPGTYSGAANLNPQAPQVVRKAAEKGKYVEYISLDRRANCAEDNVGWKAAAAAKDYHVAADYYFNGKSIDGKTYAPPTPNDLKYLGDFGLAMTLDDWRAVITYLLPDRKDHVKMSCGGHSLGAFLVGPMLAWDFDGNANTTDDAGFNLCGAGGIPQDGLAITDPVGFSGTGILDDFLGAASGPLRDVINMAEKNGLGNVAEFPFVSPANIMNTYEVAAMAATQHPDAESDLKTIVKPDFSTDPWMRIFYGKDYVDLVSPVTLPRDFRLTNTAALGMFFDQNSSEYVLQAGLGFYDCPTAGKTYPIPNGLASVPILGPNLFIIPLRVGFGQNYTPSDRGSLCGWNNYDKVWPSGIDDLGSPQGPPTNMDVEVTDMTQFAQAVSPGWQPTDFFEKFTPVRLLTDIVFALAGGRSAELGNLQYRDGGVLNYLLHGERWQSTPAGSRILTLLSGDSPVQNTKYAGIVPANARYIPGYRHYDVVTAAEKQNTGLPELASSYIAGFMTSPR